MKRIRIGKIAKYFGYTILGVFLIVIIVGNIYSHFFTYDKVPVFPSLDPKRVPFINDTVVKKITIQYLYTERMGDSIYMGKYEDKYNLILWKYEHYKSPSFSNSTNLLPQSFEAEQLTWYSDIPFGIGEIETTGFSSSGAGLSVHFDNATEIKCLAKEDNYEYYNLKGGIIYVVANQNSFYDTKISLGINTRMDVSAFRYNNRLYLAILFPNTIGLEMDSLELSKMLKL